MLDLGGQDSKVVLVERGNVKDFVSNDRCAASTGRYLENMAQVLGMSLKEMSSHYKEPIKLSSTCAIFGETELIGLLASGKKPERLAAGVNYSIIRRFLPLIKKYPSYPLCLSGGVAQNKAITKILKSRELNVIALPFPQFGGALGTLLWGLRSKKIDTTVIRKALSMQGNKNYNK